MKKDTVGSKLHSIRGELQTVVAFIGFIEKKSLPHKSRLLYEQTQESLKNIIKHLDSIETLSEEK